MCSPSGTGQPDGGVLDGGRFDGLIILKQWPDLKTAFISAIKIKVLSTFASNSSEETMAPYSSVLAWRIPGTGEPGGLSSMGSHRVRHDCSNLVAAAVKQK